MARYGLGAFAGCGLAALTAGSSAALPMSGSPLDMTHGLGFSQEWRPYPRPPMISAVPPVSPEKKNGETEGAIPKLAPCARDVDAKAAGRCPIQKLAAAKPGR
jgi:hypothetical protein